MDEHIIHSVFDGREKRMSISFIVCLMGGRNG